MYAYAHACAPVSAGKSIEERERATDRQPKLPAQHHSPSQPLSLSYY